MTQGDQRVKLTVKKLVVYNLWRISFLAFTNIFKYVKTLNVFNVTTVNHFLQVAWSCLQHTILP